MLNTLLIIGITASTFLTGLFLDPVFPMISESREAKAFICWMICLVVGCYGFKGLSIKNKNIWVNAFVFYTIATLSLHPHFRLKVFGIDFNGVWNLPVVIQMLGYYLMYLTIANAELDLKRIFKTIFYCGFFSSIYIFIQAFNIDQLFVKLPTRIILGAENADLTSFIGQNTLAGAFIAMTIPFGFYFKRYLFMVLMALAVVVTMCKMAIASLIVGGLFYGFLRIRSHKVIFFGLVSAFLILAGVSFLLVKQKIHIKDNGRFGHWSDVLRDFNSPQVVDEIPKDADNEVKDIIEMNNKHTWQLTGIGPGAYPFIFVNKHRSIWKEIHNEPLEVLYGWGWIGFLIFVSAWLSIFFHGIWNCKTIEKSILLTSFLIISLNSITNFIWHVDPTRFLTVLIAGLL